MMKEYTATVTLTLRAYTKEKAEDKAKAILAEEYIFEEDLTALTIEVEEVKS